MRGIVIAAVAGLLLAACGDRTDSGAPTEPAASPTAVLAASGEVTANATLLGDGQGAELCLGGVADSLPPQCDGPEVTGWDWAEHPETDSASGVRWGEFHVTGRWDGTAFTVTEARPATEADWQLDEPPPATSCDAPEGGWGVIDPSTVSMSARNALGKAAKKREDYGLLWIDNSINPSFEAYNAGDYSPEVLDQMNDPSLTIVNIGVTGDPSAAEADLRPLWGGALCVYQLANTEERLREVAEELRDLPGNLGGGYGSISTTVELSVIYDDGSIQQWADQTYGEGVVEVTSALRPSR